MDINDVVYLAKAYNDLGWAVQEQLQDLLEGHGEDANANAVRMVRDWAATADNLGAVDADMLVETCNDRLA